MEAVVAEALLGDPRHGRRRSRSSKRGRVAEARVVDQDEQDVGRAFRRRRRHVDRPVCDRRIDRSADRAAEIRIGNREYRPVRAELPHRLGERLLQGTGALLVALDDRTELGARECLLDAEPLLVVEDRDDPGRPRRQVLSDLVVDVMLDPVVDELADHPARDRPDGGRREQRRRKEADRDPDAASPAHALAAAVVTGLSHGDTTVLGVRDQDHALDRDLFFLDECDERLEVLRRLVDVLVARDEQVGRCLSHRDSPFDPLREDSSDAQVSAAGSPRLEGAGPAHVTL